jgi:hypothetical protein
MAVLLTVNMHASSDGHAFSLEHEMHIGAAGAETFWRFKQLMLHGYEPNFEYSNDNAFWFDHPRRKWEHHSVALYPDGVARSIFAKEETVFERRDKEGFKDFLRNVPYPTWWERGRGFREKVLGWLIVFVVYGVLFLVIRLVSNFFKS